ncbi:MAG: MerR family transcriptional regulator [Alphaproteobacteria bacterium]
MIFDAANRSLDIYLNAVTGKDEKQPLKTSTSPLLRIGQLAKETGESNATIRYWTKEGLLEVSDTTASGYQLYAPEMIKRVEMIRDLQRQRFTLSEIKDKMQ